MTGRLIAAACILLLFSSCNELPWGRAAPFDGIRGVTLVSWWHDGYEQPSSQAAIGNIAASGATHLIVMIPGHQADRRSNSVRADALLTPTPTSVRRALGWARSAGLTTVIKPHIIIDDGTWIGLMEPSDPAAWFDSYREFLLPWATLARDSGCAQFVVGTELAGTIAHEQLWKETIDTVRALFPGELLYAASWDEAALVPFWERLDYAGVNFFAPVTRRKNPGRFEILSGWQMWLDRLELLRSLAGRKVVLTEIGYRSVDGAGLEPYRYDNPGEVDLIEQADLFWAGLEAVSTTKAVAGVYWWNWAADGSGGASNRDYTPFNKPAQRELEGSWKNAP